MQEGSFYNAGPICEGFRSPQRVSCEGCIANLGFSENNRSTGQCLETLKAVFSVFLRLRLAHLTFTYQEVGRASEKEIAQNT
jgi:hypothetical protein